MFDTLWRNLQSILHRGRVETDATREIDFHLNMDIERRIRGGQSPVAARRAALRDFGAVDRVREEIRDARGITFWESLVQDLRYGLRALAKSPGYTSIAVLTLALGIGANTAIFSLINGVLLKPLPYEQGERLVRLRQSRPLTGQPNVGISIQEAIDYRQQLRTFEDVVEYHQMSFVLLNRGEPGLVDTGVVSSTFFEVLGVKPLLGRTFVDEDDDLGSPAVLVLSHAYWQQRFGGDRSIVGQVFQMNDRPHTVVGVLPPLPQYPDENDVYMPTSACPFRAQGERRMHENRRSFAALRVFGRIKPGVTPEQVAADVDVVSGGFTRDYPAVYEPERTGFITTTVPLHEELTRQARPLLLMLVAATGLVLLIACANVANLSLARTMRRERELAVRAALGASRLRLLRQLLTESTLVALAGGVFGLLLASAALDMLKAFVSRFTSWTGQVSVDGGVLLFTITVSVLTGLVFGIVPAFSSRINVVGSLKEGGAHAGDGVGRQRLRRSLIVAQVTVSFVLLMGAGLLMMSLYRLAQVDPGFRSERVVTAEIFGHLPRYGHEAKDYLALYDPLLERLESTPGVLSAAMTNAVPLGNIQPFNRPFEIAGRTVEPDKRPVADQNLASESYFATLGIPLLRGRTFTRLDHADAPRVAIINRSMARAWGDADPIASEFAIDGPPNSRLWFTVVGIVSDVRQYQLDREAIAQFYTPVRQLRDHQGGAGLLVVRAQDDPGALAEMIKQAVWAIDPQQPVDNIRTLEAVRSNYLAPLRLIAVLLGIFAGLALVITVAGLSGVIATSVSQRTHEFGVRMALGASRSSLLAMVLRQGVTMVVIGLVLGAAAAYPLGRVFAGRLYATTPTDPLTFLAVAAVFVCAGAAACLGPARRATSIDPLVALRTE
jgi:predicted permease